MDFVYVNIVEDGLHHLYLYHSHDSVYVDCCVCGFCVCGYEII